MMALSGPALPWHYGLKPESEIMAGLFFYNHVFPKSGAEGQAFLQKLKDRGNEGLETFSLEVSKFTRTEIGIFLEYVLPRTFDEDVLAIFYQDVPTIKKMGLDMVTGYFELLYKNANNGTVSQEFFEESAECLIKYYDASRGLNLLAEFSKVIKPADANRPAHALKTDKVDLAMAGHLRSVLPILFSNNTFLRSTDSLRRIELPESLGVLLKNRIDAGDTKSVMGLVGELFTRNCMSDRYIEVCRREVGDQLFLQACVPYVFSDEGIKSVARLAPIFGEETFHTPAVISRIRWSRSDTTTPDYIKKFHEMGFDEKKLPLLAEHVCNNLPLAMRYKTNIKAFSIVPETALLANRLGKGAEALSAFIEGQRDLSGKGAGASPAQIIEGLDLGEFHPDFTMAHRMANTILLDVVDAVGIGALKAIAPDVSGKFVAQYISAKSNDLNRKEIFRLFPQAKGALLESDLGM